MSTQKRRFLWKQRKAAVENPCGEPCGECGKLLVFNSYSQGQKFSTAVERKKETGADSGIFGKKKEHKPVEKIISYRIRSIKKFKNSRIAPDFTGLTGKIQKNFVKNGQS